MEDSTVHAIDLAHARWRRGSRSNTTGGACVEVAFVADRRGLVAVRDSKDPAGPALLLTDREWRSFLTGVRTGALD
ncbi:MAG: DUF397 domain-containing protein [Pseudonocardiaceae bacterium]